MARFLFATVPAVGHTVPALPVARALVERGHTVRWYTGAAFAEQVSAVGATFCPITDPVHDHSRTGLDACFPERSQLSGLRKLQFDLVHGFAKPVATQVRDLTALLAAEPADVLVSDTGFVGACVLRELGGPTYAAFGVTVLGFPSRDLAPFGTGLAPSRGPLGRVRNRVLDRLARKLLFRPMTAEVNAARAEFGLRPTTDAVFDYPRSSELYLQFSPPGFEYATSDLPSQVRFVGPPRPQVDPSWTPPDWWAELADARRVVLVTQGTVATSADELLRPTLRALADQDVFVVAVTGGADPSVLGHLPANARAARFVPFDELLPYVDVFVTNGGYGGVQLALTHGVPVVGAGKTEDKIEVNARVAYSGVGLDLRTQKPKADDLRAAVLQVLDDQRYRARARRLQAEISSAGQEARAAELLEQLATLRPVESPGPVESPAGNR